MASEDRYQFLKARGIGAWRCQVPIVAEEGALFLA